jgi:hypothetical protein
MFEQVFENLRTATETSIHMQQELFKKWAGLWPTAYVPPGDAPERVQKVQKQWVEFTTEQVKKQRQNLEAQFSAGLKNFEESFRLAEAKDPVELRAKTVELWQKSFDCLRKLYEAQTRDFQEALVKWTELVNKGAD